MASLSRVAPAGENLPVKEGERSDNAAKVPQQSQVSSQQNGMTPAPAAAVYHVFNTTELIEMILLQDTIPLTQLFVLQRVSKKLRDVIVGSQQLKLKMLLTYDTKVPHPSTKQELEQLIKDNSAPFFNPLMLVPPAPDKALVQTPIFRHVLLLIPIGMMQDMRIWILAEDALQGAAKEELKPHQGGSWEKMKLC